MMPNDSWTKKLNDPTPKGYKMRNGKHMLLPTARMVDDFIRSVPMGEAVDVGTMRARLAADNGAEVTCPVTLGRHLRTAAEAAWEAHREGAGLEAITPFWRVFQATTPASRRLACGIDFIVSQRIAEGLKP